MAIHYTAKNLEEAKKFYPKADSYTEVPASGDREAYVSVVEYKGRVLETRERNGYDDSDFYAIVLDQDENGRYHLTTVEYATTRFGGGGSAIEDLAPENLPLAVEALRCAALAAWKVQNRFQAEELKERRTVRTTRTFNILVPRQDGSGKKAKLTIPVGTTGVVQRLATFNTGYSKWNETHRAQIVLDSAIANDKVSLDAGSLIWTDQSYLEVNNSEWYLLPESDGEEAAERVAQGHNWSFISWRPGYFQM